MVAGATVAPLSGAAVVNDVTNEPQKRASDNRRSNKPIMEKRRRARINNCLNELKTLILDAMKKDPARHSKLEKADILEMTVRHLESLQRQQTALATAADPGVMNKFRAGYAQCCGEVSRFPGLEPAVKRRLMQHLAGCLVNATNGANGNRKSPTTVQDENVETQNQVHILPAPEPAQQIHLSAHAGGSVFVTTSGGQGVQLMPTRLPNGDIALVLPASKVPQQQSTTSGPQMAPQMSPNMQQMAYTSQNMSPNSRLIPNLSQLHTSVQSSPNANNIAHNQMFAEQRVGLSQNNIQINQRLSPNVMQQNVVMINQCQNAIKQNLAAPQATSVIVPTLLSVPQRTNSTHSASSGSCSPASFCYVSPPTPPKSSHSGETPERVTFSPEINDASTIRPGFQKQCSPEIDVEERLNQLNNVANGLQSASSNINREHKRSRNHLERPESPQGPISLVVRRQKTYKAAEDETNPCWRPW